MKIKIDSNKTIEWLIGRCESGDLTIDRECQRAPAWKKNQKQIFIDSVFRGYSTPPFYFYENRDKLEIIDGLQRIIALSEYHDGVFTLLNPETDSKFYFPNFVEGKDCAWAGKRYQALGDELKNGVFLRREVVIYRIQTEDHNEVRDLFIRLQGGLPLTAQEKRDSWPGNFTRHIFHLGGKEGVTRDPELRMTNDGDIRWIGDTSVTEKYPGHKFFTKIAKPAGAESKKRQLAATIFMLYFHRRESRHRSLCDAKSADLDNFYRRQVNFGNSSQKSRQPAHQPNPPKVNFDDLTPDTWRFKQILDLLESKFSSTKLKGHYAIGLALPVDSLLDNYAPVWMEKLKGAYMKFNKRRSLAKQASKDKQPSIYEEYLSEYINPARTGSDSLYAIQTRHYFFAKEMLSFLNSLSPMERINPERAFSDMEEEMIYHRDKKMCRVCLMRGDPEEDARVFWPGPDAEFYLLGPVDPGNNPVVDNAILIRGENHPQTQEEAEEIRRWAQGRKRQYFLSDIPHGTFTPPLNKFPPPEGTERLFEHKEATYVGKIKNKMLVVNDQRYPSFSVASCDLTGTNKNGWRDWWLLLAGSTRRILADDWRRIDDGLGMRPELTYNDERTKANLFATVGDAEAKGNKPAMRRNARSEKYSDFSLNTGKPPMFCLAKGIKTQM